MTWLWSVGRVKSTPLDMLKLFYKNDFKKLLGILNGASFINFIHRYNKDNTNSVKSSYVAGNDIIQIRKMKLWSCKIQSQVP